jgi:ParB family chromosome partitioning protein
LDGRCFQTKIANHIDREIAARPELVQIETVWRNPKEQRPGALQRGHYREIEAPVENPDAEFTTPCASAKTAIIVYGKRVGTTLTVCTDDDCPIHDPNPAHREAPPPPPMIAPAPETETQEEAEERQRHYEQQRKEYEEEQERETEERKREFQSQHEEHEAERARIVALHQARVVTLARIVDNAPAMFSAAQLRVLLTALVTLNPEFIEGVASEIVGEDENNQQTPDEVLLSTIAALPDDKLAGFAVRLVFTDYSAIPREGEVDRLAEAEAAFAAPQPERASKPKKAETARAKVSPKKKAAKKSVAA